eukprot:3700350-Lingulodinium_polyedra.AAC.1
MGRARTVPRARARQQRRRGSSRAGHGQHQCSDRFKAASRPMPVDEEVSLALEEKPGHDSMQLGEASAWQQAA